MEAKVIRKLFLGFIQVHILFHARQEPFFGVWMLEELQRHGYRLSAGTLYPILHDLEAGGLLKREERVVEGRVRKYYTITAKGSDVLEEAKQKARELLKEIGC